MPRSTPPPRFLVCPPDHFDTHFLFNPFMTYRERVRPRRARRQWSRLVQALEQAGAEVEVMEPSAVSGALPFTADGALCYAPGRSLILRNEGPRGDLEPGLFRDWFKRRGYEVESLPPDARLDGGNLLRAADGELLVGLKRGQLGKGETYLAKLLGRITAARVWGVELLHERHMHLDTALGLLGRDAYLIYSGGLRGGLSRIGPLGDAEPIEVGDDDARRFACNVVTVGKVVITGRISRKLALRMERHGYRVERVELDEFNKAGGGAKCLTLPLWPQGSPAGEDG